MGSVQSQWYLKFGREGAIFALTGKVNRRRQEALGPPMAAADAVRKLVVWFRAGTLRSGHANAISEMTAAVAIFSRPAPTLQDNVADLCRAITERRMIVVLDGCYETTNMSPATAADLAPSLWVDAPHNDRDASPVVEPVLPSKCTVLLQIVDLGRRSIDTDRRLQVVASRNPFKSAQKLSDGAKAFKAIEEIDDLMKLRSKYRDFKSFSKEVARRDKREKRKKPDNGVPSFSIEIAQVSSGHAEVEIEVRNGRPCKDHHGFNLSGHSNLRIPASRKKLELTYGGAPPGDSLTALPTQYRIQAAGCTGGSSGIDVDVFPGDQKITSFSLDEMGKVLSKITDKVRSVLKKAGADKKLEITPNAKGSLELFEGWREDRTSWRAGAAIDVSAEASASLEVSISQSLVALVTHVPEGLLKYLADVTIKLGVKVSASLRGTLRHIELRAVGSKSHETKNEGSLCLTLSGSLPISLEATLGNDVIGAEITGTIELPLEFTGAFEWGNGALDVPVSLVLKEGEIEIAVCTRAFIWEKTSEKSFHLWDEHSLYKDEWPIYPIAAR